MKEPIRTVDILRVLHDGGVEFVVIGGAAVIAYGSTLVTQDLDLCAPMTHENCARIIEALQAFHPRWRMRPDLPEITPDNPNLNGLKNFYLRTDLGQIDILGEVPEVCSYRELLARSVEMTFHGVPCRVIDIDTLIAAKRVANRERDLLAIRHLEAVKAERARRKGS
jgi:predicted nucleotidyltransferase